MNQLTIITVFLVALNRAVDFKFSIVGGQRECFGDQLPESMLLYGKITSSSPDFKFDIYQVEGEREDKLDSVENESSFDFHHVTEFDGEITMCFEALEYAEKITILFSYEAGGDTHDFTQIAKTGQAASLNATISEMELMQKDITRVNFRLIETEGQRNLDYNDVSTKIIGFCGVTFAMLLIVAACQVIYIKRYFSQKKLI